MVKLTPELLAPEGVSSYFKELKDFINCSEKDLTMFELHAFKINTGETLEMQQREILKNLIAWRRHCFKNLEFCEGGVVALEKHLDSRPVELDHEESAKENDRSLIFPEEKQLYKMLQSYKKWLNELLNNLPEEKLSGRSKRNRKSVPQEEISGDGSPTNHQLVIAKPSLDWLNTICAEASEKFPNLWTKQMEGAYGLKSSAEFKQKELRKAREDIVSCRQKRRSGIPFFSKVPLGLHGHRVLAFRRLWEECTFLPIEIPEMKKLKQTLEEYDFIVLAKDTFFPKTVKDLTNEKVSAIVDYIPAFLKERFDSLEPMTNQQDTNLSDQGQTRTVSLLRKLKKELISRDLTSPEKRWEALARVESSSQLSSMGEPSHDTPVKASSLTVDYTKVQLNTNLSSKKRKRESIGSIGSQAQVKQVKCETIDLTSATPEHSTNLNIKAEVTDNSEDYYSKRLELYRVAKKKLAAVKMPFRYTHGWILKFGNVELSSKYHDKTVILPIGYSCAFKYYHPFDARKTGMYRFKIAPGPQFMLTFPAPGSNGPDFKTLIFNSLRDMRSKMKYFVLRSRRKLNPNVIHKITLKLKILIGLHSKEVSELLEGLPYVLEFPRYRMVGMRTSTILKQTFGQPMEHFQLHENDLRSLPSAARIPKTSKFVKRSNKDKTQGKTMPKTYFKNTDFSLLGQSLRNSMPLISKSFVNALEMNNSAETLKLLLVLPGMLAIDSKPKSIGLNAKTKANGRDIKSDLMKLFSCLVQATDLKENVDEGYKATVTETTETDYSFSFDIFRETNRSKLQKKRSRFIFQGLSSPKRRNLIALPQKQPYFDNFYICCCEKDSDYNVKVELLNVSQNQKSDDKPFSSISGDVYRLYQKRLSALPCNIFLTNDCICGHTFHSPRITLILQLNDTVASSCTLCLSSVGFMNGEKEICILEIEGIATDVCHQGKNMASLILLSLRKMALDLQKSLGVEVAMVAKTSLQSEQWWSSRKGFFRSLREIRKIDGFTDMDASRWKKWIMESGAQNHQFFNHQENMGRSAFWVAASDDLYSDTRLSEEESLSKAFEREISKCLKAISLQKV